MAASTSSTTPQTWKPIQKKTFIVAAFAIVVGLFSLETAPYILTEISEQLDFSIENANIIRIAPYAASLLAVFIAGTLGDIFGSKKVLLGGAMIYCVGTVIALSAQSFAVILTGRALEGIGTMLLRVVSLAMVTAAFPSPAQQAIAFSGFAAVSPATQIFGPSIAAALAGLAGWRPVVGAWLLLGVLFMMTTAKLLPRDPGKNQKPEFTTPILAGLALILLLSAITAFQTSSRQGLALLAIAVIALGLLSAIIKRLKSPAFDWTLPSQPGAIFILLALAAANATDPIFFTTLFLQKQHNLLVAATSFALIPLNVGTTLGNLIAGPIIARIGAYRTILTGFLISAAIALSFLFIKTDTPIAVIIAMTSSFLLFKMIGSPAMLTMVMGLVPARLAGMASSWRNASQILGVAIGGVVVGSIIFNTFQSSLTELIDNSPLPRAQAEHIAGLIRQGNRELIPLDLASMPAPALNDLIQPDGPAVNMAEIIAYRALGPAMAVSNVVACLALWVSKQTQTAALRRAAES
ncbi:MAG: MFS transporter [Synechococcus sp. ELA057]